VGEIDQGPFTRANRRRAKYRWQQKQNGEDKQLHDGGDGENAGTDGKPLAAPNRGKTTAKGLRRSETKTIRYFAG
jgi:hypothetical protein